MEFVADMEREFEGRFEANFFSRDPLTAQPHEPDVSVLNGGSSGGLVKRRKKWSDRLGTL